MTPPAQLISSERVTKRAGLRGIVLMCAVALMVLTGCEPAVMQRHNLDVRLSRTLVDSKGEYPGVDVYIRGMDDQGLGRINAEDVDSYIRSRGHDDQQGPERVFHLGANEPEHQLLPITSDAWDIWLKHSAQKLVIIANYPRPRPAPSGLHEGNQNDPRMLTISLFDHYPDPMLIEVTPTGLDLLTQPGTK